jgi:NADPH-ferrihemoprotein reductase
MSVSSSSDVVILALGVVLAAVYLFRDQIFVPSKSNAIPSAATKVLDSGDTRDFVAKMKAGVSFLAVYFVFVFSFFSIEKTTGHVLWFSNGHS